MLTTVDMTLLEMWRYKWHLHNARLDIMYNWSNIITWIEPTGHVTSISLDVILLEKTKNGFWIKMKYVAVRSFDTPKKDFLKIVTKIKWI